MKNVPRETYDVIVVGAGHAGCEAAAAAARLGARVALVTYSYNNIGQMSCNPAIGGVAKGIIVKELDALDGLMPRAADMACLHFKLLNSSKGPAVWGPRMQSDRAVYADAMRAMINAISNIDVIEGEATDLILSDKGDVVGVELNSSWALGGRSTVVTSGTFLDGKIRVGSSVISAGRIGEAPSIKLAHTFREKLGLSTGRLKTGTPPRLFRDSINWDMLEKQPGDIDIKFFSYASKAPVLEQICCYIGCTTPETHKIILSNKASSPIYNGSVCSSGPRYCPSIEDKVTRFTDKDRHRIFMEPEGLDSDLIYPNGISTSMPEDVQDAMLRSIAGLEEVEVAKYGYCIEYDYIDPTQLDRRLAVKGMSGLFLAGQINGTTGYEEAAGQGLIAGVNSVLSLRGEEYVHTRSDSYIGVMIDDLTTKGTSEPYRVMTSRAEFRISLRPDNADLRLTRRANDFGFISDERFNAFIERKRRLEALEDKLSRIIYTPSELLKRGVNISLDGKKRSLLSLLGIPQFNLTELLKAHCLEEDGSLVDTVRADALYKNYAEVNAKNIRAYLDDYAMKIPEDIDYTKVKSISAEAVEKLQRYRPSTIAHVKEIAGITPTTVMALIIHINKEILIL